MTWYEIIAVAIILGGVAWIYAVLYMDLGGPTRCIGCGKCVADGKCILTGKPVGKKPEKARDQS